MSNAKVKMVLEGYEGPFFPTTLDILHAAYARDSQIKHNKLEQMGTRIEGFLGVDNVQDWYRRLTFKVGKNGRIAVVFAWFQDRNCEDGTMTDRHTALYVQGGISLEYMSFFAARLAKEFQIVCTPLAVVQLRDDIPLF